MRITFVKKILASGEPCPKCHDVEQRLIDSGQIDLIDETVVADERDPESAGMQLASAHSVKLAPFFIVEQDDGETQVYTIFMKFSKEVLKTRTASASVAKEIMRDNPDLDFI